jgi:type VI secretion system protein ImpE
VQHVAKSQSASTVSAEISEREGRAASEITRHIQPATHGEISADARAFDAAPATPGEMNGTRFDWIADADMRLGPILEVIVNGKYFWMPFGAVADLRCEPPVDLRDAVWMPASLTVRSGGEFVALIPTRYAGTVPDGTAAERLSRATNWSDAGAETWIGRGQRLLTTDGGDVALMDLRALRIDPDPGLASGPGDAPADG